MAYKLTQKYTVYSCLFIFTVKVLGPAGKHSLPLRVHRCILVGLQILFVSFSASGYHFCRNLTPLFPCMIKICISSCLTNENAFFAHHYVSIQRSCASFKKKIFVYTVYKTDASFEHLNGFPSESLRIGGGTVLCRAKRNLAPW